MQKRGLSDVVTTVLIILLVIVSVAIIWAVVRTFIGQSAGQIDISSFTTSFSVVPNSVRAISAGSSVSVSFLASRSGGDGEVSAINVVVEDSTGSAKTYKYTPAGGAFNAYETQKITASFSGLKDATKISLIPIVKNKDGKEITASVSSLYKPQASEQLTLPNGLVGYWKFDEDAGAPSFADLVGSNPGTPETIGTSGGAVTSGQSDSVSGKSVLLTKGGDGGGYVNFGTGGGNLIKNTAYTIALWFKPTVVMSGDVTGLLSRVGDIPSITASPSMGIRRYPTTPEFYTRLSTGYSVVRSTSPVLTSSDNIGRWYFVSAVFDGSNIKMYIDGTQNPISSSPANSLTTENYLLYVGSDHYYTATDNRFFTGNIDEVMIFNRKLESSEIKQIYDIFKP